MAVSAEGVLQSSIPRRQAGRVSIVGIARVDQGSMGSVRHYIRDGPARKNLPFRQGECHGHTGNVGDAARHGNSGQHVERKALGYALGSTQAPHRCSFSHRRVPHSRQTYASWMDCQDLESCLQSQRADRYQCGRSIRISTCSESLVSCLYLWAEGWMLQHHRAVAELLDKAVSTLDSCKLLSGLFWVSGISLTGIGHLGNLVTIEAVPFPC